MLTNRSAPYARVTPVLTVADVRAAVDWYAEVLGLVEHVRIGDHHRAQLGLPDGPAAELVVAEVRPGRSVPHAGATSHQVMFKVEDVLATVVDPFGHQWVLNQTLRDVPPEAWGGESVAPRPDSTTGSA